MPQTLTSFTTPLAANARIDSGFQPIDPAAPYVNVVVSSDQSGTIIFYEKAADSPNLTISANVPVVGGNPPLMTQIQTRQALWRVVFVNGSVAQTSFSLVAYAESYSAAGPSDFQIQWAILKELRAISMLLANLKEPTGSVVNLNYGVDPVTPN